MTKKQISNIFFYFLIVAIAAYLSYTKGWILADFESISPKQANALLKNDTNITLLDVRTADEFSKEHLEGSILIPVQELSVNLSKLDKEKKIIVYCHSGMRSVAASRILAKNGFVPLNITGGISAWKSDGLGVTQE